MDLDFFVYTRCGVGVTDPHWLRTRLEIFSAVTLPSLLAQTDQRFAWAIFVGPTPVDWFVESLAERCASLGDRVEIVRHYQSPAAIKTFAAKYRRRSHMIAATIDDDDAWHVRTVEWAVLVANDLADEGLRRVGFSFRHGYEWLISDLVDVDALQKKGLKIIRPAGVHPYTRPFHGMSCFILSENPEDFDRLGGLHSSEGKVLEEHGIARRVFGMPAPAWLYVRHAQVDSALHKAHANAPVSVSLAELARDYGIDAARVEALRAGPARYAVKRAHGLADKSNLTFELPVTEDFRVLPAKRA
jgi:hypothetical protein